MSIYTLGRLATFVEFCNTSTYIISVHTYKYTDINAHIHTSVQISLHTYTHINPHIHTSTHINAHNKITKTDYMSIYTLGRLATFNGPHVAGRLPSERHRKQMGRTIAYSFRIDCMQSSSHRASSGLPQNQQTGGNLTQVLL